MPAWRLLPQGAILSTHLWSAPNFVAFSPLKLDGNGDTEPGVLMTAQTITSESLCTTTTTHITKVGTAANTHAHMLSFVLRHAASSPAFVSADAERRPVRDEDWEAHRHHRGLWHRPRRGQYTTGAVLVLARAHVKGSGNPACFSKQLQS